MRRGVLPLAVAGNPGIWASQVLVDAATSSSQMMVCSSSAMVATDKAPSANGRGSGPSAGGNDGSIMEGEHNNLLRSNWRRLLLAGNSTGTARMRNGVQALTPRPCLHVNFVKLHVC